MHHSWRAVLQIAAGLVLDNLGSRVMGPLLSHLISPLLLQMGSR